MAGVDPTPGAVVTYMDQRYIILEIREPDRHDLMNSRTKEVFLLHQWMDDTQLEISEPTDEEAALFMHWKLAPEQTRVIYPD